MVFAQKLLKIIRRAITAPDPNHLRWKPSQNAKVAEISIFGNYYEVFTLRIFANLQIAGSVKTDCKYMFGMWKQISQARYQSRRQVVVKKQLHSVATRRCFSRSAA